MNSIYYNYIYISIYIIIYIWFVSTAKKIYEETL